MLDGLNGGVLFIRPCAATEASMLRILAARPKLRFTYAAAEQDFCTWCVRGGVGAGMLAGGRAGRGAGEQVCGWKDVGAQWLWAQLAWQGLSGVEWKGA